MAAEAIVITAQAASPPQVDPGLAGLIGAIITGIVTLVGHFILQSKNKNDKASMHVEGFKSLTDSLQAQITEMREDMKDMHAELEAVRERKTELIQQNRKLMSENHTKDEIIKGFSRWHELWEQWFKRVGMSSSMTPPPEYTWQMRQYLSEVRKASDSANRSIHDAQKETGDD